MRLSFWFFLFFFLYPFAAFSLPAQINPPGEKMVLVDPVEHRWGAYNANGVLIRSGLASAGADWCADMNSPCHTEIGRFRVKSLGNSSCKSPSFPIPTGGSPMPYCMYFNKYQALHGSYHVVEGNISHGCIRMHVSDAKWLRNHFVNVGTLVVIQPY
jgi:lipoprotein-anchoring transpeptidase ErfK/SrfK